MFDTHAIARALTAADLTDAQADAITDAVRQAAEHGEHVTPERLRAELAALEPRLIKWMVGIAITLAGILTAAGAAFFVALLRTLGTTS